MSTIVVAYTTVDDPTQDWIAEVVSKHLAACVQVSSPLKSFYWWDGSVQEDTEYSVALKTSADRVDALREYVLAHHSYDSPQWYTVEAEASKEYGEWVQASSTK